MFFCFCHVLTKCYHYDQLNKNQWLAKFSGFIYSCFLSITIKLELIILFCLLHNLPPNTQLTLSPVSVLIFSSIAPIFPCFLSAYYYTVSTKTGAQYQGGTDGKVFIRLTGDRGSTDKIPLTSNLPASARHFKTGQ